MTSQITKCEPADREFAHSIGRSLFFKNVSNIYSSRTFHIIMTRPQKPMAACRHHRFHRKQSLAYLKSRAVTRTKSAKKFTTPTQTIESLCNGSPRRISDHLFPYIRYIHSRRRRLSPSFRIKLSKYTTLYRNIEGGSNL